MFLALFFLMLALPIQGHCGSKHILRLFFCISVNNATENLIGATLTLQVALGSMDMLTI